MKGRTVFLICLACLLLVGCGAEGEMVAEATPTAAQLPATGTPMEMETTVPSPTIAPTGTATPQPIATSTNIAVTVTETPVLANELVVIEGYLLFFWDTEVPLEEPTYYSIPILDPKQDLYIASPGETPDDWQVTSLLKNSLNWPDEAPSWPIVALSPDQIKIAFTVDKETSDGAKLTSIYLGDLTEGTIKQLTEDDFLTPYNISWLPDNQTIAYSLGKEGHLLQVNDLSSRQFTPSFSANIGKLIVSPNGQLAALTLESGELMFTNVENGQTLSTPPVPLASPNNVIWSPDSQWLATNLTSGVGLNLINSQTSEIVSLVSGDTFAIPAWSPGGTKLAYIQGTRDNTELRLWEPADPTSKSLVNLGSYLKTPVWSPDNSHLAVAFLENGIAGLQLVQADTGESETLTPMENIISFEVISWSPNSQWLLVFAAQEDKSCLYIVSRADGNRHCVLDSTATLNPFAVSWISGNTALP
jgi:Tol biopolymer transport system component